MFAQFPTCCCADLCFTATGPAGGILLVILLSHFCHICLAGDAGSCLRHLWQIQTPQPYGRLDSTKHLIGSRVWCHIYCQPSKRHTGHLELVLFLCFPELQFRVVWYSTTSVVHHYHLQITGYWLYKLLNHFKSQFPYLSNYYNNHFCFIKLIKKINWEMIHVNHLVYTNAQ